MLQIWPDGVVHFTPVRVVHIVPESLVHYSPVEVVHYTPVCSETITGVFGLDFDKICGFFGYQARLTSIHSASTSSQENQG